jgi:hypothetical protein
VASGDDLSQFEAVTLELSALNVTLGIIGSISERWPPEVQEQWEERLDTIKDWATEQMQEAQMFAASWDE